MGEDKINKYTAITDPGFGEREYHPFGFGTTYSVTFGTSTVKQPPVNATYKARPVTIEDSYWSAAPGYTAERHVTTEQIPEGSLRGRGVGQSVREEEDLIKKVEIIREYMDGWYEDYVKNDNKKSLKSRRHSYKPNSKAVKQKISLEEALAAFNDIANKDLGDVILSGSIALAIQGIISRREFKDIDVISFQKFELDDDMSTYDRIDYPVQQELGQLSSFLYDGYLFDVFIFDPTTKIKTVEVEHNGETYLCQHYSEIIMAKLRMVFPKIKDIDEIKKYIDFNIL